MLKVPCNVADQIQVLTQCRLLAPPRPVFSFRRRNGGGLCAPGTRAPVLAAVVSDRGGVGSEAFVQSGSGSLADRLRLGSLAEDGLSYKERFIVRCYEVGINKTATVETIANLLQEVGCNHAQSVGFSTDGFATTPTMRKLHLIWVTARMHIEIYKYPAWSDVVEIETWCQGEGKIGTRRDWILKDYATDQVIGRATRLFYYNRDLFDIRYRISKHFPLDFFNCEERTLNLDETINTTFLDGLMGCIILSEWKSWVLKYGCNHIYTRYPWVMMNQDTRRLQKVSDDVRDEYLVYCPRELRLAFPEENNSSLRKIPKLEDPGHYSRLGLMPRRADLDMNQHVNNVTYIGWVLESMPQEIISSHELQMITLDYRRECQQGDVVDSLTSVEEIENDGEGVSELNGANGYVSTDKQDSRQFLHLLRLSGDGLEINRGRTEWRKKQQR